MGSIFRKVILALSLVFAGIFQNAVKLPNFLEGWPAFLLAFVFIFLFDLYAEGTSKTKKRIFIAYKRKVEPDETVAETICEALRGDECEVFIDKDMPWGTDWEDHIKQELKKSDYLIALLSTQSAQSDHFKKEIEIAHKLKEKDGHPIILSMLLNYNELLTPPLDSYLGRLNWASWNGEKDTPELIKELKRQTKLSKNRVVRRKNQWFRAFIRSLPFAAILLAIALLFYFFITPNWETIIKKAEEVKIVTGISPTPTPTISPTPSPTSIPILSDKGVRQAIAHCIDRDELIKTVYPFLSEEERKELLMYSFLPQNHPFVAKDVDTDAYAFDQRTRSNNLLSQAGWELPTRTPKPHEQEQLIITDTVVYRKNSEGKRLDLEILTTDEPKFREKYVKKIEDQLENCGIRVTSLTKPATKGRRSVFNDLLPQRDFDLVTFASDAAIEPRGSNRYACNQIPSHDNKKGENHMGWCNEDADKKLIIANNTLDIGKRKEKYRSFQHDFTEAMVSLPLFAHQEVIATSKRVENLKVDRSVDSYVANIAEWKLTDGDQNYTVTLGLTREPSKLFLENESDVSDFIAASLLKARAATSYSDTYQAVALKSLPTIENGGATNEIVKVNPGETVWTTKGMTESLHSGVQVIDANGEPITYTGSEALEMKQLKVTFVFTNGLKWEDGQPLVAADLELAKRIGCESRALNPQFCASIEDVQYSKNSEPLSYTITYYPGVQWPEYFVQTLGFYSSLYTVGAFPAHQEVDFNGEKRKLTEIPTKDLLNLTEIVTKPLSYGPYKLLSWDKGKQMVFAANPSYYKGEPKIKRFVIKFFGKDGEDPAIMENTAVNELLDGTIDVLSVDGMDRMKEIVEEGKKDAKERKINTYTVTGAMWEHLDMNLDR